MYLHEFSKLGAPLFRFCLSRPETFISGVFWARAGPGDGILSLVLKFCPIGGAPKVMRVPPNDWGGPQILGEPDWGPPKFDWGHYLEVLGDPIWGTPPILLGDLCILGEV